MNMLLLGPERKRLREILLETFDRPGLVRALAESNPSREFEHLVSPRAFADQVFELIDRAEQEGWLDALEAMLQRERSQRLDILEEIANIFGNARARAEALSGDAPAPLELRSKLVRFATVACTFAGFCVTAGAAAWVLVPDVGIWGLPAAVFSCVASVVIVGFTVSRRHEPRAFLLSRMPLVVQSALALALIANTIVLGASWEESKEPNFVVQLVEGKRPLAKLNVKVARVDRRDPMFRITNLNGEAFFRLRGGSQRLYSGEVEVVEGDRARECQFPAFTVVETRKITHDLKDLNCRDEVNNVFALRADQSPRISRPVEVHDNHSQDLDARLLRAPLGLPKAAIIRDRLYYTLGYDPELRAPDWVAFTVDTRRTLQLPRRDNQFRLDPDILPEFQSNPRDYRANPYDRGTLIRRADALMGDGGEASARAAESEIFYYSATVPQPALTNRVTWAAVEVFTSEQSGYLGPIHVVAGPVYPRERSTNLPYLVIGPGRTAVPVSLFRVLLRMDNRGKWRALAFLVPNDGSESRDAIEFATSVSHIEKETGLTFFPDLQASEEPGFKERIDVDLFVENSPTR